MVQEVVSSGLLLLQHHLLVVLHQVVGGRARVRAALSLCLGQIKWNSPSPKCRKLEFPLKNRRKKRTFGQFFEHFWTDRQNDKFEQSSTFPIIQVSTKKKTHYFFQPKQLAQYFVAEDNFEQNLQEKWRVEKLREFAQKHVSKYQSIDQFYWCIKNYGFFWEPEIQTLKFDLKISLLLGAFKIKLELTVTVEVIFFFYSRFKLLKV